MTDEALMTLADNPAAFPCVGYSVMGDSHMQEGMTLRDYFAGQAITICLKDMSLTHDDWAKEAYSLADAMLRARALDHAGEGRNDA